MNLRRRVEALFGEDGFEWWVVELGKLAAAGEETYQNIALKQVDSDAHANRHKAEELAS